MKGVCSLVVSSFLAFSLVQLSVEFGCKLELETLAEAASVIRQDSAAAAAAAAAASNGDDVDDDAERAFAME